MLSLYSPILIAEGSGVISFYITKTTSSTRSKSPASNNAKGGSWYSRTIQTPNPLPFNPRKLADDGRCCKIDAIPSNVENYIFHSLFFGWEP
jgi:hypothetical protein